MTANTSLQDLNTRFAIPGVAAIVAGEKGLPMIQITTPAAEAHIYLHGAHVAHYQRPHEPPILYMDKASWFEDGKPIRGGVPVIFPWFGPNPNDASLPAHGLVRQRQWSILSIAHSGHDAVAVELGFSSNEQTRQSFPHDFELRYKVTVGKTLSMALTVTNKSDKPLTYECALHTYFRVGDIQFTTVDGLQGVSYYSKVEGNKVFQTGDHPITFTAETDRVYLNTRDVCVIKDPILNRRILVEKEGSLNTVVWNPWIAKAKAMPDFTDDAWPIMLCIEAVNSHFNAQTIQPAESRTMTQIVH